ncbi:hypothetical protein ABZ467_12310 [Streptomyces sp. NPDC005727]|uniref:hypothetical protein n=1 Tax=Streptomyces sp. NPDC005727 TaxID=3157053 RepID=UPI0033FA31B4
MGIRMLHRRTPEVRDGTRAEAGSASGPATAPSPVPALAAGASTARIPLDRAAAARRAAARLLRRRGSRPSRTAGRRARADLARAYLALLLTAIPRARPRRTLTVFVAALTEPPTGPGPRQRPPRQDRPEPGPDATP